MFSSWVRRKIFWLLDAVKGKPIKTHYNDLIQISAKDDNSQQLKDILAYAKKNVQFYKGIKNVELSEFPVMTKSIYKEQKSKCISMEYPETDELYKASTSGSTGTPLTVYINREKKNRERADLIRAHEQIGWNIGDHYVFIRNWVSNYKQSRIKNFAQNVTTINISEFNTEKKTWLCNHLKKHRHSVLFGYSSSICDFMHYVENEGINSSKMGIKVIVCDSDELTIANKRRLESVFNCPVINRYDNEENGLLAISKPRTDLMEVNWQSLYIELLSPYSDTLVKPGEMGRVVVTDLFNHAMPLIRYDIGDYATSLDPAGRIRTLNAFSGRKADCIYSTAGMLISNVAISGITEIFESISKYQIEQQAKNKFVFRYVGSLSEHDFRELDSRLHGSLENDAEIQYDCVSDISVGKNGKFKPLINNWNESDHQN